MNIILIINELNHRTRSYTATHIHCFKHYKLGSAQVNNSLKKLEQAESIKNYYKNKHFAKV